mmetsp:Transcript_12227/g.51505  ORF Transcript_12227/g.51505 Transcript_12227/m.51505 type:complete len:282 (-) Transcript_12227:928-1773(-)
MRFFFCAPPLPLSPLRLPPFSPLPPLPPLPPPPEPPLRPTAAGGSRRPNAFATCPKCSFLTWKIALSDLACAAYARMWDTKASRAAAAHDALRDTCCSSARLTALTSGWNASASTSGSGPGSCEAALGKNFLPAVPFSCAASMVAENCEGDSSAPASRSTSTYCTSVGSRKSVATPERPARAARPMRCTYSLASPGASNCTISVRPGKSSPRAATSVHSNAALVACEKARVCAARSACGMLPCRRYNGRGMKAPPSSPASPPTPPPLPPTLTPRSPESAMW